MPRRGSEQRLSPPGAVGIDIGGTKIAVAAVGHDGAIQAEESFPTEPAAGFDRAVGRIALAVERVVALAGWNSGAGCGIGIGCAGPVNPRTGRIHNPHTLTGWGDCDIVTPLRERFEVPVRLENDADAAALGEWWRGAGRGSERLIMLTFGTGIGGSVLLNGEVYRGCAGEHPEIGHLPVLPDGPDCYCGIRGCFESVASGGALEKLGKELGFADPRSTFQGAAAGDPRATELVDQAIVATGRAVWTLLHTFLPDRFVFGGGLIEQQYDLFFPIAQQMINQATMVPGSRIEVAPAVLGNRAGLVGAAALILRSG